MSQIAKRSSKILKLTLQKLIRVDRCTVAASWRYGSIQPKSDLEHHPRCTRRTCRRVDNTLHGRGKNPVIVWFRVLIVGCFVVVTVWWAMLLCKFRVVFSVPRCLGAMRRRSWAIVWPPNACQSQPGQQNGKRLPSVLEV